MMEALIMIGVTAVISAAFMAIAGPIGLPLAVIAALLLFRDV